MDKKTPSMTLVDEIGQLTRLINHLHTRRRVLQKRLEKLMDEGDVFRVAGRWYEAHSVVERKPPLVKARREVDKEDLQLLDSDNVVSFINKFT